MQIYDQQRITDFKGNEGMTRVMERSCPKCEGTGVLVDGKAERYGKPQPQAATRSIPAEFSDGEEEDEATLEEKFGYRRPQECPLTSSPLDMCRLLAVSTIL